MVDRTSVECPGCSRRGLLRAGAAGALALALPRWTQAIVAPDRPRRLAFHHLHTHEEIECVYWRDGAYLPEALERIDHHLRDHRTGEVAKIDRALLDRLNQLRVVLGTDAPFQVVSGFRSRETNDMLAAQGRGVVKRSFHTRGMAIDVAVEDQDVAALHRAALDLGAGGVGLYDTPGFIHLDVGPTRRW